MAGIKTSIELKDGVSPALNKMAAAVENLHKVLNKVDTRFSKLNSADGIETVAKQIASEVKLTAKQLDQIALNEGKITEKERQRKELQEQINVLKSNEFFKNTELKGLRIKEAKLLSHQKTLQADIAERLLKIKDIEGSIAAALADEETSQHKLEKLYAKRETALARIDEKQKDVAVTARQIQELGWTIGSVKARNPQDEIDHLMEKQNQKLREQVMLQHTNNDIREKAIRDQEKLANTQAKMVQDAWGGIQKLESANIKAAQKAGEARTREFNKAQEQQRGNILAAEKRAAREAAAAEKQAAREEQARRKSEEKKRVEEAILAVHQRYENALSNTNKKYEQTNAHARKLERTIDRQNAEEVFQLNIAKKIAAERLKIHENTQKLVNATATLRGLEAQGITTGVRVNRLLQQQENYKRKIRNSSQNIKTLANQTFTVKKKIGAAINQNAKAQKRFNGYVRGGLAESNRLLQSMRNLAGAYLGYQSTGGILSTADRLTTTGARLDLINDGSQTTDQLKDKIYNAAMNSRSGYVETVDLVGKMATRAGSAFSSNDEVIAFTNTLQKMFHIAGASVQEMNSASLQLVQALGSGVLRGEEFNAVFEAAPNVMMAVADYMGKPIGELKELASEGKISADIVKNAMFAAAEETNKKFASMPVTWAQTWVMFKNSVTRAFEPLLKKISKITSSKRFIGLMGAIGSGISNIAEIASKAFDKIKKLAALIYDNWKAIQPTLMGAAGAFLVFVGTLTMAKIAGALWNLASGVMTARMLMAQGATWGQVVAQTSLNSAIFACPFMWLVIGLGLLLGALGGVAFATEAFGEKTVDWVATARNVYTKLKGTIVTVGKTIREYLVKTWEKVKDIALKARDAIVSVANAIADKWNIIAPIIWGIVAALVAYKVMMGLVTLWTAISAAAITAWNAIVAIGSFVAGLFTGASWGMVVAIIAIAVAIGVAVWAIMHYADNSVDRIGMVCGAFWWLFAVVKNVGKGFVNVLDGVVQFFENAWKYVSTNFSIICDNIGIAWNNLWLSAKAGLIRFVAWAIGKLADMAKAISPLTDVLGIDLSGLGLASAAGNAIADAFEGQKKSYKSLVGYENVNWQKQFKYDDVGDAYAEGEKFGKDLAKKVKNFKLDDATNKVKGWGDEVNKKFKNLFVKSDAAEDAKNELNDLQKALTGGYDNPTLDQISKNTGDIAKSSGETADNTADSDDNFKYIHEAVRRDSMNRNQLMNFKVDMSNVNHMSSNLDVNEVMRRIAKELYSEVVSKMEGVY